VKPSGPGALDEPKLERTLNTSSSVGIAISKMLSSAVMIGGKSSANSSSISGDVEAKRLEKCETKEPPIYALSENQPHSLDCRKLMALDLLLITVEEWKNFVLRSEQVSQVSLDFCFQRVSS
jgi:hypothetical protein